MKPGKDPPLATSYRPISLLSHSFKLMERLLLNRISPFVEEHLIDQQAGFRPGKSTTGQLFNLTQYIEDGFQEKKITGAVFVDLTAAYDTVNHRRLLTKILRMTKDPLLTNFLGVMLTNRRFFVELNNKKSRVRLQRNGLLQGSVLAPLLYNIYQRWSRGHKARGQGQGHKKNPRPRTRTAFPRTDTLEAKDRNARGQGPRTQALVLSKNKKVFTKIFQAISKKKKVFTKIF